MILREEAERFLTAIKSYPAAYRSSEEAEELIVESLTHSLAEFQVQMLEDFLSKLHRISLDKYTHIDTVRNINNSIESIRRDNGLETSEG